MVTISVKKSYLLKLLGRKVADAQLEEALHQIKAPVESASGDELQVEVTGDRPDLLSAEGLARGLKGQLGIERGIPEEKFGKGKAVLLVDESVKGVREFIVAAEVEGVSISADDMRDLIQVQEKLTLTHGRKRKKVAIGLHDAGSLVPPYYYKAMDPEGVEFVPLGRNEKMNLREIVQAHEKGIEYGWILGNAGKYPVIFDSRSQVLSFPPIINGTLTEMGPDTKRVFIDVTGTDYHACNAALNILCQDFYDRGAAVKTVEVRHGKRSITTPETAPERMELKIPEANRLLGMEFSGRQVIEALGRQRISAKLKSGDAVECLVPRYRADFLHPVDLIEEIALGHGYNAFQPKRPSVFTKGGLLPITKLQDTLADALVGAGFQQLNNPVLTAAKLLRRVRSEDRLIGIKNPASEEYGHVRASLLPQLLVALSINTHNPYPQRIFEIGLVAREEEGGAGSETRAANELHVSAAIAHSNANLSELSGALLEVLRLVKAEFSLHKSESAMFVEGRRAVLAGKAGGKEARLGVVGEIHPAVLEALKLEVPLAAFEINVPALRKG